MPELPEVETTVQSLNRAVKNLRIIDVWSSYNSAFHDGKDNIKDVKYFKKFRKAVIGKKILLAGRVGKNIIINLSGGISILVHMKMTGHFLYGKYKHDTNSRMKTNDANKKEEWKPTEKGPLNDPMNRFIRMIWTLSNKKHLAFSDLRRFAKICYFPTEDKNDYEDLKNLGPEPLLSLFTFEKFKKQLLTKPNGKIKQVLMDQSVIAGIGNIYSDEILWHSGIHPFSKPEKVPAEKLKKVFVAMKKILDRALKIGGDSTSDFRGIDGRPSGYQNFHKAYRQTGKKCPRSNCAGKIARLKIAGRSAHFCDTHQTLYKI